MSRNRESIEKDIQYERECLERIAEMLAMAVENSRGMTLG